MTPYKQLNLHKPKEGSIGDCFRTALGCLLDTAPTNIPHFVEPFWEDSNSDRAKAAANAWLRENWDLVIHENALYYPDDWTAEQALEHIFQYLETLNPNQYVMLSGKSKNNCCHVVIASCNGIVHDPAIDESGIVGPYENIFWISTLVPSFLEIKGE